MNPLFHIDIAKERAASFRGEHSKAVRWQPWSGAAFFNLPRRFTSLWNWAKRPQTDSKQAVHTSTIET